MTDNRTNEEIFKEAWHRADRARLNGGRVKAGLEALEAAGRLGAVLGCPTCPATTGRHKMGCGTYQDALRTAVPDAATEEPRPDELTADEAIELVLKRPGMYGLVPKEEHRHMKAERDAALAALERIRVIHASEVVGIHEGYGEEVWCPTCKHHYPCPTVAALDGVPDV